MARIIMLYQDEKLPSSRVRVLNLVSGLRAAGLEVVARPYPRKFSEKVRVLSGMGRYDLVFLQKKLLSKPEFLLLQQVARRIAFDFDDAIYMRDDKSAQSFSRTRLNRFKSIVRGADLVVAGNPVLAEYARRFSAAVQVVPSAVPHAGVAVKNWQRRNKRFVVGWVGSGGNLPHLSIAADALRRLAQEIDLELRVVSNREYALEGVPVKNVTWRLETQEQEMAEFDVGIMPLPTNAWTEGKCSYKLLQYMAAGVPVVGTDWGFNRTVIEDGKNGFLAREPEDFYRHIKTIHNDPAVARELGAAGRHIVGGEYAVDAVVQRLASILSDASREAAGYT